LLGWAAAEAKQSQRSSVRAWANPPPAMTIAARFTH